MSRKGHTTTRSTGSRREGAAQLRLLANDGREQVPADWVLSERTRKIGLAGVATIRETLRQAQPPDPVQKAS